MTGPDQVAGLHDKPSTNILQNRLRYTNYPDIYPCTKTWTSATMQPNLAETPSNTGTQQSLGGPVLPRPWGKTPWSAHLSHNCKCRGGCTESSRLPWPMRQGPSKKNHWCKTIVKQQQSRAYPSSVKQRCACMLWTAFCTKICIDTDNQDQILGHDTILDSIDGCVKLDNGLIELTVSSICFSCVNFW